MKVKLRDNLPALIPKLLINTKKAFQSELPASENNNVTGMLLKYFFASSLLIDASRLAANLSTQNLPAYSREAK